MPLPTIDAFTAALTWWFETGATTAPQHPVLVVLAGDTEHPASTLPAEFSTAWRRATEEGLTATHRLADELHVELRVVHDDEPHLTDTDLLLLGDVGRGLTTAAAIAACRSHHVEPQLTVGRGSGINDLQWMTKTASVRDGLGRAPADDPWVLQAGAALLADCAERTIPVLLDGVVSAACAGSARHLPRTAAPVRGKEPGQEQFLQRLGITSWIDGLPVGAGLGALAGYGLLRMALAANVARHEGWPNDFGG